MICKNIPSEGTHKVYWNDVRDHIKKIEPTFFNIVDELDPGKGFPLFLSFYPYGDLIGDTKTPFIPTEDGKLHRLTSSEVNKEIRHHLGYGSNSLPFGMVIDKELEACIVDQERKRTLPSIIFWRGGFFSGCKNIK